MALVRWLKITLLLVSCNILVGIASTSLNDNAEGRLLQYLNLEGRRKIRPVYNSSELLEVSMSFHLTHIKNLNVAKQELTVVGEIFTIWNDPYLVWNESEYDNIKVLSISSDSVWVPPFVIWNSLDDDPYSGSGGLVLVRSNGLAGWATYRSITTICNVDVYAFPFDVHTCIIGIFPQSYANDVKISGYVTPKWEAGHIENYEWSVVEHEMINIVEVVPDQSGPVNLSRVQMRYKLQRQASFYTMTIIFPVIVLFLIGLLVFPLPVDSGEKISLSVTCLMSFFIIQLMISEEVPKSWHSVPVIMTFNSIFMLLNVLSVCVTVLVLNLHHKNNTTPVPHWLHRLTSPRLWIKRKSQEISNLNTNECGGVKTSIALNRGLVQTGNFTEKSSETKDKIFSQGDSDPNSNNKTWKDVATIVNSLLSVLYFLTGILVVIVCLALWRP